MVSLSTGPCAPQTLRIQSHSMLSVGFSRCLNKTKRLKAAGTVSESCSASKEKSWKIIMGIKTNSSTSSKPTPLKSQPMNQKKTTWNETHLQPLPPKGKKKQGGDCFAMCFSTTTAKLVHAKHPKLDFVNLKQDCTPLALEHAQLSWRCIDNMWMNRWRGNGNGREFSGKTHTSVSIDCGYGLLYYQKKL